MKRDQAKKESLFSEKLPVRGRWVAVMNSMRYDRGIILTSFQTRCFKKNEIHEFIICDANAVPTKPIDSIAYLGFGEIIEGGVVAVGDTMYLKNRSIGIVLGFDETHVPNHYNIIIKANELQTGFMLGVKSRDTFLITFKCMEKEKSF